MSGTETVEVQCPYCGETIEIVVDCSVESQSYIEDCQVCCRHINLTVAVDEEGIPSVEAISENDPYLASPTTIGWIAMRYSSIR